MKHKILIIFFSFILLIGILIYYVSIHGRQTVRVNLVKSGSVLPTTLLSPTPSPIVVDPNSNLKVEVKKLDPADFSPDFEQLKKEINNF